MKKRLIISVLSVLLYHLSYSQSEYASFDVPFKNALSISSIPDEKGNICYGFRFEKDYYFVLLSKNKEVLFQEKIHETSRVENYFCGTISNENQFVFFNRYNTDNTKLIAHIIYKDNPRYEEVKNIRFLDRKKEEFIEIINTYNEFYIVSVSKKTGNIYLTKFNSGQHYEKRVFHPDMPDIYKHFKKSLFSFSRTNLINPIFQAYFNNKIYKDEKKFIFTFKKFPNKLIKEKNYTEILALNWKTSDCEYTYFVNIYGKSKESYNSTIYKDRFFQITILPDLFNLTIYDLKTFNLITSYNYQHKDYLELMSGPLIKKNLGDISVKEFNYTKNTLEVTDKLSKGHISICANKLNSELVELEIGSFSKNGVNIPLIVMGGMLGGAIGGAIAGAISARYDLGYSNYFRSVLSYPEMNISISNNTTSIIEKLQNFIIEKAEEGVKISGETFYQITDNIAHYGYINKKEKKFVVIEFDNN